MAGSPHERSDMRVTNEMREPRMSLRSSGLRSLSRRARKRNLAAGLRQINPTAAPGVALAEPGQITSDFQKSCQARKSKIFRFPRRANQRHKSARLTRQEGRIAIVTNVRWDAVDARVPITNGAHAYDKNVWS